MQLSGKVAIVTGGARGIGLAIAARYLAEGAHVVIADVDLIAGEAAAKSLGARNCRFVAADVGDARFVERLMAETLAAFGRLDILVNNAGIIHTADFLDIAETDFDRVLRVNLKGAFLVGQAAARQMVAQVKAGGPPGAIINMSSVNAVVAIPDQVPYCVSKGGIDQLTKVMALSLAPYGIRVNAIGPGSIMTDILKGVATDIGGPSPPALAHAPRPHRRAGGGRLDRVVPCLRRRELRHGADYLLRRRPAGLELHGAGEGRCIEVNNHITRQSQ